MAAKKKGNTFVGLDNLDDILFNMRNVYIIGPVGEPGGQYEGEYTPANHVIKRLITLDEISHDPIKLVINSPGGDFGDGMAIFDTMMYVKSPVHTIATGIAASMAAMLLSAGAKGHRYANPHARMMIHLPISPHIEGDTRDVEISYKETQRVKDVVLEMLAVNTGKGLKTIETDIDRRYNMNAFEAVEYGLIDKVLITPKYLAYSQAVEKLYKKKK